MHSCLHPLCYIKNNSFCTEFNYDSVPNHKQKLISFISVLKHMERNEECFQKIKSYKETLLIPISKKILCIVDLFWWTNHLHQNFEEKIR